MKLVSDLSSEAPWPPEWLAALQTWAPGGAPPEALLQPLTRLTPEQGEVVQQWIRALLQRSAPTPEAEGRNTDAWRAELLACRARAWAAPARAGLLVGPTVLILTDGERGVVLSGAGLRPLSSSVSASLLLLCQTIVLADHALDTQELGRLRQQRIESSSTSLSQIKPVP